MPKSLRHASSADGPNGPAGPEPAVEAVEVPLGDGRKLGLALAGPPSDCPVVYVHGFLGSRLEPLAVGAPGHRLVTVDRPGYGSSSPFSRLSLAGFGRDLAIALDHVGVDRMILVGASAGAPFALAGALALGPRVQRLVLVGGVAGPDMVVRGHHPVALLPILARHGIVKRRILPQLLRIANLPGVARLWLRLALLAERDGLRSLIDPRQLARRIARSVNAGTGGSAAGMLADIELLTRPWDIDPSALKAPTVIVHGRRDEVVPWQHALWYRGQVAKAKLVILERHYHVSAMIAVAGWLQCLARRQAARIAAGRPPPACPGEGPGDPARG